MPRPRLPRPFSSAKVFGAQIHLLHVYDIPDLSTSYGLIFPNQVADGIREAADRKLDEWKKRATAEGVEASSHLEFGSPERVIVHYAQEAKMDLIVMATRGLGAIEHILLGSVAERTMRTATCPVLTIRANPTT